MFKSPRIKTFSDLVKITGFLFLQGSMESHGITLIIYMVLYMQRTSYGKDKWYGFMHGMNRIEFSLSYSFMHGSGYLHILIITGIEANVLVVFQLWDQVNEMNWKKKELEASLDQKKEEIQGLSEEIKALEEGTVFNEKMVALRTELEQVNKQAKEFEHELEEADLKIEDLKVDIGQYNPPKSRAI